MTLHVKLEGDKWVWLNVADSHKI